MAPPINSPFIQTFLDPSILGTEFMPSAPPLDEFFDEPPFFTSTTLQQQPQNPTLYLQIFNHPHVYKDEIPDNIDLISNFENDIQSMPMNLYSAEASFPVLLDEQESIHSPIHFWLRNVSAQFIKTHKERSSADKIHYCEKFLTQFLNKIIINYSNAKPITEQPFFGCLDYALRIHLFNQLLKEEKSEITFIVNANQKFPDNLIDRENALEAFLTKNACITNPCLYFYNEMVPMDFLKLHLESCISKAKNFSLDKEIDSFEQLIQKTLTDLNLITPSLTTRQFNYFLRKSISDDLILKQADKFKENFSKTGKISKDEFNKASIKVSNIINGTERLYGNTDVTQRILTETFGLCAENGFSFQPLRDQVEAEKSAPQKSSGFFSFLSRSSTRPFEVYKQKLETLAWAEQMWIDTIHPLESSFSIHLIPTFEDAPAVETVTDTPLSSDTDDEWVHVKSPTERNNLETLDSASTTQPPAIKTLRPTLPAPAQVLNSAPALEELTPRKPEPVRILATSDNIPLVSYINIAFANCIQAANDDLTIWNSLPDLIKKDALRHCYYLSNYNGKAEEIAARLFKTTTQVGIELKSLENNPLSRKAKTGLSPAFIEKGEALLQMYYSSNRLKFYQEFHSLPKEPLFYKYVYEMAKAAGIHIESWDHHFAEYNWNKITMMNLSVQALERCLHTDAIH